MRQLYIYCEDCSMAFYSLFNEKLWIIAASTREPCISSFLKKRVHVLMLSTCRYVHLCIYSTKSTKHLSLCLIIGCLNWPSKYSGPRQLSFLWLCTYIALETISCILSLFSCNTEFMKLSYWNSCFPRKACIPHILLQHYLCVLVCYVSIHSIFDKLC